MRIRLFLLMVLIALSACQGAADPSATPQATNSTKPAPTPPQSASALPTAEQTPRIEPSELPELNEGQAELKITENDSPLKFDTTKLSVGLWHPLRGN